MGRNWTKVKDLNLARLRFKLTAFADNHGFLNIATQIPIQEQEDGLILSELAGGAQRQVMCINQISLTTEYFSPNIYVNFTVCSIMCVFKCEIIF